MDLSHEKDNKEMARPDKDGLMYFVVGLIVALIPWGLQMIGVTVNVWFGGAILAIAFVLMVYAFWVWERSSKWHILLRIGTIIAAAAIYFLLVGRQIAAEWLKERSVDAAKLSQSSSPPVSQTDPKQSTKVQGNNNAAGNINQNGNQNTAIIGNGNNIGNTYTGPELSGWLVPGTGPTPLARCTVADETTHMVLPGTQEVKIPNDHVAIFLGTEVDIEKQFPRTIIQALDEPRLILEKDTHGKLAVTMDIFDSDPRPRIIAKIVRNEFTINPNDYFSKELSKDHSRLQIIDQHDTKVLDIHYINKRSLSINAVLYFPGIADPLVISDKDVRWRNQRVYGNCITDSLKTSTVIDVLSKNPQAVFDSFR